MYPSPDNPAYGVFIKNIETGLGEYGLPVTCKSVIKGRGGRKIDKIMKYVNFYFSIFCNYFKSYDFIYVHYPTYSAPILLFLLKLKRKKIVINYHGEDLIYDDNLFAVILGKLADKLTRKYADLVVVPSNHYRDVVVQRKIKDNDKIFVSPSGGIDTDLFTPKQDFINRDFTLGFVGRLQEDKGILEFISVCKHISESIPISAYIIGYGPLLETVRREVANCSYIKLIEGVEQSQLPSYYNKFDLFCFPSKRITESLGLVGLEAMACGVPVIGTNIGGIPTYLFNRNNGFLISMDDIEGNMKSAILSYHQMSLEEKEIIISNCIKTAESYDHRKVIFNLAEVLKHI
jgi:glycosyltransferase involved in cell wall biosynthesis